MPLQDLADELLLCILGLLDSVRDINTFARLNRRIYNTLNVYLYQYGVREFQSWGLFWAAENGQVATARMFLDEGAAIEYLRPDPGSNHC